MIGAPVLVLDRHRDDLSCASVPLARMSRKKLPAGLSVATSSIAVRPKTGSRYSSSLRATG